MMNKILLLLIFYQFAYPKSRDLIRVVRYALCVQFFNPQLDTVTYQLLYWALIPSLQYASTPLEFILA